LQGLYAAKDFTLRRPRNYSADYTGTYTLLAMFLKKIKAIGAGSTYLWLYFRTNSLDPPEQGTDGQSSSVYRRSGKREKSAMTLQRITADTLIHPDWIIPVLPHGQVLEEYSIALAGERIAAVLPRAETGSVAARQIIELPGKVLLPGLVNCHGHAAMSLLRGYADDQPLMPWLEQHIWPAERAHVSAQFVSDGTELAIAEMIRSGTTTFSDMYFFPNVCAATAQRLGMRCQITFPIFDFPSAWGLDADDYINKGLALRDDFKHSSLVTVGFGPHAPYTLCEANLAKIATLAAELDAAIHIHLHETSGEVLQAVEQNGERPLDTLQRLGLLGPRTQCVHMTDLGDQDIALLAATGAHVVHCPQSNMKLASGTCRVSDLLASGVNVSLGTDSAASNNALNMFGEMKAAALLAKLHSRDATALPAADTLAMATINGAKALGLEDSIGSLISSPLTCVIPQHSRCTIRYPNWCIPVTVAR
jgi:5-methylthioadenosine/S-adenosylhomocysteine deaminase